MAVLCVATSVRKAANLGLIYLVASSEFVMAEPSPTVNYLINEPVSLFDRGMDRLAERMSESPVLDFPNLSLSTFVDYNLKQNRIEILGIPFNEAKDVTEGKIWCKQIIHSFRGWLGVEAESGSSAMYQGKSLIYRYYTHHGYTKNGAPSEDEIGKALDEMTHLEARIRLKKSNDRVLSCQAALTNQKVLFSE